MGRRVDCTAPGILILFDIGLLRLFSEHRRLLGAARAALAREACNLGEALHECVVRHRLRRAFLSFAKRVETICEFTGDLRFRAELRDQVRRSGLAAGFEYANEMVDSLPVSHATVGARLPVLGEFRRLEETHLAALGF